MLEPGVLESAKAYNPGWGGFGLPIFVSVEYCVEPYKAVIVQGGLIGGHWQVENDGKTLGAEFRLDKPRAELLAKELNAAYMKGRMEERARDGIYSVPAWPSDGQ